MANTLNTLPDLMVDTVLTTRRNSAMEVLDTFTLDVDNVPIPKRTRQVQVVTGGATPQINATNFQSGDSTVEKVDVEMDQVTVSFHMENADLQDGRRIEDLVTKNWQIFENQMSDQVCALIDKTTFGANKVIVASDTDMDASDVIAAIKLLPGAVQRNAILDHAYFTELTPTIRDQFTNADGYLGLDKLRAGRVSAASPDDEVGFVCDPQAIVVAARVPYAAGGHVETRQISSTELGIPVQMNVWVDAPTRQIWMSYDAIIGAAVADAASGVVIANS